MSYDANSNHVIKNIWDDALPNENVKWDFSYDADIVVFALNTNDNNYCRNNNKTLTVESIKAAVNEMITNVRTHNPDCQIILIGSFSSKMNSKLYNADEAMTEIAENDDSIYYIDVLPSGTSGVGYHPTVAEHLKGGTYLAEFIKTNLLK